MPSTTKISGNETSARNPPTAGPMLMPRLIASRFNAIAALRCSGGADSVSPAIVAGRTASATTPHGNVSARMTSKWREWLKGWALCPMATRAETHRASQRQDFDGGPHGQSVHPVRERLLAFAIEHRGKAGPRTQAYIARRHSPRHHPIPQCLTLQR